MIVNRPKKKKKSSRYKMFFIIMGVIFGIITLKLVYLQIYKHDDYQEKADTTATKFVSEKAPRGKIYDQKGNILATNKQTYVMTYTTTDEANKTFYSTMDLVFNLLKENNAEFQDDLILKLNENNEWYFQFKATSESGREAEEIRFKRDRGLNEDIEKKLFTDDEREDLDENQVSQVNEKLLEMTPKEVFYELVKSYNLIELIDSDYKDNAEKTKKYNKMSGEELTKLLLEKYSEEKLRTYILVKDALKMQSFKGYKSVELAKGIKKETAFILMQKLNDLPGIDVSTEPVREYPYETLASSVLGYISSIDTENKEKYELKGYDASTDLVGTAGIESAFEDQLKGVKGGTTVKVNSKGRTTSELFKLESYPGNNVCLTIDKDIQYAAEKSFTDNLENLRAGKVGSSAYKGANRGAVVAVEVNTGRILASVSYPGYNPNDFATGDIADDKYKQYFDPDYDAFGQSVINTFGLQKTVNDLFPIEDGVRSDKYDLYPKPFYNYATQGLVAPGSTFKPMTAVAGLESGVITPSETIYDTGVYNIHPEIYGASFNPKCLIYSTNGVGHGPLDLSKALAKSCNFYFYDVAYRLFMQAGGMNNKVEALDSLAKYAWRFGLGVDPNSNQRASTGIELPENYGTVYNFTSYKNKVKALAKYNLRDCVESGNYNGTRYFVPFDFSSSEDDEDDLRNAKIDLKNKITDTIDKIGTDKEISSVSTLRDYLLDDVKTIMDLSPKYKANVQAYESSGKGSVNIESQAKTVAEVIASFIIQDTSVKSPAQEVYAAIGQGMNTFTPMQLAQYISTLANGGTKYALHYVDKITDSDGNIVQEFKPEVLDKFDIKPENYKAVVDGMKRVNEDEENGTASTVFTNFPISTAGKTGTADFREDQTEVGREPYATYVSFAPADDPKIAVVAVAYDGGHGGNIAYVAKAIYEAYFKDEIKQNYPEYANNSESFKKYVLEGLPDRKDGN